MIRKDGQSGDAGIFVGKALKGVLCGRTIMALDTAKGMKAMDQLMDAVAENQWDVLLPDGLGLTRLESCWIKACSDRLFTTGGFAGSGPRTPAASEFRPSIVVKSDFSGPQAALDDQNSLLLSPIPKVLLPHQRSLQEPCSKGVAWDLKFAAFGRHSAAVARHLNVKQLALSVMLFRSSSLLLFSTLRRK